MADLGFFGKVRAIHDLIKTELPVAAGICVLAGEVISGQPMSLERSFLGFAVGFFISGTAMMTNDYWDIEVDRINHPARPLPSGRISVNELKILALLFTLAGLSAAMALGLIPLLFSFLIWIIGILYNWRFKESGLLGNLMVSISVASTFILGGISVGGLYNGVLWLFGLIAFLFDLGEEIANGAMDVEGDAKRNVKSLARIRGKRFAINVSAVIFVGVISLTLLPYFFGWLSLSYLISVVVLDLGVAFSVYRLKQSRTPTEGRRYTRVLYILMVLLVLVIMIVRLFGL